MKNPKHLLIGLFFLTTVVSSSIAWKQYQELINLRAASLDPAERSDLQKRQWELAKRNQDLERQLASHAELDEDDAMAAEPAGIERPETQRADRPRRRNQNDNRDPGAWAGLLNNPKAQSLMAVQQKAALDGRYAALFRNLNLPPEQLEKFKNLLAERNTSAVDVLAAARSQGIDPRKEQEAIRKMVANARAEVDSSIKAVLGEAAYTEYKAYDQTLPLRNAVSKLEQRLSYTPTPMTAVQANQMVQILASASAANPASAGGAPATPGRGGQVAITKDVLNLANGILSGPQVAALQQLQQEQQAQQELARLVREAADARRNATRSPAPSPGK